MDILKLRDWYRTPLGHTVRRTLQSHINELWPSLKGMRVLVLGYGEPYIGLWNKEGQIFCAMFGHMGAFRWPENQKNRSLLTSEDLPFFEGCFDRILIAHGLEFAHHDDALLSECQRVLKDDGEIILIVPNRSGAWSRVEVSPLARGRPYSSLQISKELKRRSFQVCESRYALYVPPSKNNFILRNAPKFERFGKFWRAPLGGIVIVRAKKDIFRGTVIRMKDRKAPLQTILYPREI